MARIKMLLTMKGSEDGLHVQEFVKGALYSIIDSLAEVFVGMGAAEFQFQQAPPTAQELSKPHPSEDKRIEAAPENKEKTSQPRRTR